jgi:hypothetical protein
MITHPDTPVPTDFGNDPRRTFASEPAVDLAGARVAVLGCGSVGSLSAWCCAGAGVGVLLVADRDRLEVDNLRRHLCGAEDIGAPKPDAVGRFLRQRFPQVTTLAGRFCFLEQADELRGLLDRCDIALVAVDDEAPKFLIDAITRELGRPVLYAGVYGGGWAAELILTDPAADTPCYACAARTLGRVGVPVWPQEPAPGYALPAPEREPTEWVRADLTSIMPCAALAARLTTAWLARRNGHERPWNEFRVTGASVWRLALRHVPGWGAGPWCLRPVPVVRQPGCPVCGSGRRSAEAFLTLLEGDGS